MPVFGVLPPIYKKDVILNMKYEYYPKRRTEQERRELNEQIIRLLQSEACELSLIHISEPTRPY